MGKTPEQIKAFLKEEIRFHVREAIKVLAQKIQIGDRPVHLGDAASILREWLQKNFDQLYDKTPPYLPGDPRNALVRQIMREVLDEVIAEFIEQSSN